MTDPHLHPERAVLATPAPDFTLEEARLIARERFAIDGTVHALDSERDQNFHLAASDGREYVLKIANPAEHHNVLALQAAALRHVAAQAPGLPIPCVSVGVNGADLQCVARDGRDYLVRVVTYLRGTLLDEARSTPGLRRAIGKMLARLDIALRGFFHPAAGHELLWDLAQAARLRPLLQHFDQTGGHQLLERVLDEFDSRVGPVLPKLRAQVIHNDFNRGNLVIAEDDPTTVCGVLDFGDMVHTPLINELAVATAYQMVERDARLKTATDLVGAYHSVLPLSVEEIGLLYDLIATRMVQSLVIGAWRSGMHPDNEDYILGDRTRFMEALERWLEYGRGRVTASFRSACGIAASPGSDASIDTDTLRERRRRRLGSALRLSYDKPLHLVRGEGVWLYDSKGRRYLDAYNNVACVGHCHPAVGAALIRQAKTLNTNTRYLSTHIVDYAERLVETLPGDLSVCMFVCTGTEANDLAWQIAHACTEGDGAIVTDNAYHGNSTAVSQLSPEELTPGTQEDWVATVPAPNTYSGPHRLGEPELGERYAACLDDAIETLRARGHPLAALMLDTAYTSDGIMVAPDGYLAAAWRRVRDAGGLCIADEVQAGFGRTGEFMWGFQQQDVVPDIVTMGKPIGNGHPLAAVVTTPEIAERFTHRRYYFNTFGGNPVSCAVGMAVLDVLQREELQSNANDVGACLKAKLERLQQQYPLIGDVRGTGLLIGVELVRDPVTREPAAEECAAVVNAMRGRGVLIGRTGLANHVLKIRPPLVFTRANADLLVETLGEVLGSIA